MILSDKIAQDFAAIITNHSVNKTTPNVEPLLQQWKNNKKPLYDLLGQNLILKFPLEVSASGYQEEYAKDMFLVRANKYAEAIQRIDVKSLIKNKLQQDTKIYGKTYPAGMKVSKIFNKIMETIDANTINVMYSNMIQTLSAKGQLCISIHPIDFLTMSDNKCNWSTCHSLHGEFRGGVLSLLADRHTIMIYVESSTPYEIAGVQTSNKKWRQLAHVNLNDEYVVFSNQHPFEHELIFESAVDQLSLLFDKECHLNAYKTNKTDVMQLIDDYDNSTSEPLHFNDLLIRKVGREYATPTINILATSSEIKPNTWTKTIVGEMPYCPICGERYVGLHKSIECHICNPCEYCCTCANPFHEEDLHYIDGENYCDTCFDNEFTYCEKCDEIVRRTFLERGLHTCDEGLVAI